MEWLTEGFASLQAALFETVFQPLAFAIGLGGVLELVFDRKQVLELDQKESWLVLEFVWYNPHVSTLQTISFQILSQL